jgi:hypothetical protein
MQIRDTAGKFAKSGFVRKTIKWAVLGLLVWFAVHSFFSTYKIVNKDGIHGVVAKATYNALIEDHAKAYMWDVTPTSFVEPTDLR